MKPEHWDGQTNVLGAPQGWDALERGECGGLPVYIGEGEMISCWAPTWREIWRLVRGQRVWMTLVARAHPPVSLHVLPRQPPKEL